MQKAAASGKTDPQANSSVKVQKLPMQVRKLQDAPQRLLTEIDIEAIYDRLSDKGKK